MNPGILFHLGLVAYAPAAALYLGWLVRASERRARLATGLLFAGFVFHGGAVAIRAVELWHDGAFRLSEGLSFLAFLVVGAYLLLSRWIQAPAVGAFVGPLVVATLLPAHAIPGAVVQGSPLGGVLLPVHIAVAIGGLALFALGFVVALMYLLLEREVKAKRAGGAMFWRLPSLELLDRLNYQLMLVGFLLLSVTIVTGAFFSASETGDFFALRSKQGFALVAWALTALVVLLRQTVGWRGRRVAWSTMVGFVLLSFAFAGVFAGGQA
ncbi:cytochrome C assembly family protein [Vulgatibacter incomptus]|uniref:HemX protein, negative effector of steady-state concentration of glutamyl-tRNA reductase n=1 Tax=Vulgatibacter incomptus TaxID=1391653 RepID=A0A0K1PCF2_9BACT|nr:cytochrome c biogenesis protein CcsA [Vulgatibacter incomptus]AKU91200.1 HemX protein, negative effector of steady-state concentration of glutamyl-tRNA reductase [Vulgatibacter incomptus]